MAIGQDKLRLLVFTVHDRDCALPCEAVREVLPLPRLWRAPAMPPPVAGLLNLGGDPVPVLAMDRLLGLVPMGDAPPLGFYAHLLLVEGQGHGRLALLVARAQSVATAPESALRPVSPDSTLNGCVAAEVELDGRLVHLLDAGRLLLEREAQMLEGLRQAEAARLAAWGAPL